MLKVSSHKGFTTGEGDSDPLFPIADGVSYHAVQFRFQLFHRARGIVAETAVKVAPPGDLQGKPSAGQIAPPFFRVLPAHAECSRRGYPGFFIDSEGVRVLSSVSVMNSVTILDETGPKSVFRE